MKFRFKGVPVEIAGSEVICKDDLVKLVLSPVVAGAAGGPEEGDPQLNAITRIFGKESVTDVELDEDDDDLIVH